MTDQQATARDAIDSTARAEDILPWCVLTDKQSICQQENDEFISALSLQLLILKMESELKATS